MAYGRWYKQEKIRSLVPKTIFHKLSIHISRHLPYAISHQLFVSAHGSENNPVVWDVVPVAAYYQ